jgi:hypothetical protein
MQDYNDDGIDNIIDYGKYPDLDICGENDSDNFQIFTPRFIIDGMINTIGNEYITDITKTVLEPASGDGAFTVRILELRLKKIIKDKDNYLVNSLRALSTIYSIEIDKKLVDKQRNNIYSLLSFYAKKSATVLSKEYIELAKEILNTNFIWGETNIYHEINDPFGPIVGWYMPKKTNYEIVIVFYKWLIHEDLSYEKIEDRIELC